MKVEGYTTNVRDFGVKRISIKMFETLCYNLTKKENYAKLRYKLRRLPDRKK